MSNDDYDMGDLWREVKKERQAKRASNRATSPELLKQAGIAFELKNGGAHLVIRAHGGTVDFWPGTGKWETRGYRSPLAGRGVQRLINTVKNDLPRITFEPPSN
jgi:hypothetical protein